MCNLHYLKDIDVDAFESCKAKLKENGEVSGCFVPTSHYSPLYTLWN